MYPARAQGTAALTIMPPRRLGVLLACCHLCFFYSCAFSWPQLASGARAPQQQRADPDPAGATTSYRDEAHGHHEQRGERRWLRQVQEGDVVENVSSTAGAGGASAARFSAAATTSAKQAGLVATTAECTLVRRGASLGPRERSGGGGGPLASSDDEDDEDVSAMNGGDEGLDERAVLLRVSPWAGCGVQVTFGLGWDEVLPVAPGNASLSSSEGRRPHGVRAGGRIEEGGEKSKKNTRVARDDARGVFFSGNATRTPVASTTPEDYTSVGVGVVTFSGSALSRAGQSGVAIESSATSTSPASSSSSSSSSLATAAVTRAPQEDGMTAIALALSGAAGVAARQLAAAAALIESLPDGELVSVWILTLAPRPALVSDVRRLRLGGRRHISRRLREVLDALSLARAALRKEQKNARPLSDGDTRDESDDGGGGGGALTPLARTMMAHVLAVKDGSARQTRVWQGGAVEVLREMGEVNAHAEVRVHSTPTSRQQQQRRQQCQR